MRQHVSRLLITRTGFSGGTTGLWALSEDYLPLLLGGSLVLLLIFWALNLTIDLNSWHRRNQYLLTCVERHFLAPTDWRHRLLAFCLQTSGVPTESLAHEHWKRYYAHKFAAGGYEVQIEAPRVGGRVDILAAKNGEWIGVEIETGKSDVVANDLRSGFQRVIVLATTVDALPKI